jgi:hypothetical protein
MSKTHLYRWFDKAENLLYVGISYDAIERFKDGHKRAAVWADLAVKMTSQIYDDRRQALEAEKLAIQTERPKFNIIHSIGKLMNDELLTLAEATRRANVSEMTLRKYLKPSETYPASRLPNARKILRGNDRQETWAIPVGDLVAAGLIGSTSNVIASSVSVAELQAKIKAQKQIIETLLAMIVGE